MAQNLTVLYKSQWDDDASESRDDCGPACISMILDFLGTKSTINEVFDETGALKDDVISIAQMQNAITSYGYASQFYISQTKDQIIAWLDKSIPVIALIHYGDFNSRQDKGFAGGHFIVVVGYRDDGVFVNDPDFWGNYRGDGDHHFYTWDEFLAGWSHAPQDGGNPANSYLVIMPKNTPKMVEVPADVYPKLIDKCNNRDQLYDFLTVPRDPVETNIDKPLAVINGYINLGKGLQNQLATAQAQVQNYKDKADRIKQTAEASATTDAARITALEKSEIAWTKERESLKGQLDEFAKAKGATLIAQNLAETKLKQEQEKSGMTMTVSQLIGIIFEKVVPFRVK